MSNRCKFRYLRVRVLAALCVPLALLNVGCCPDGSTPPCTIGGNGGPTTLVNETITNNPFDRNFNPSAAGRLITATVSGDITASRIQTWVTDLATGDVVAIEVLPTTNSTTITFLSTNNGVHVLHYNDVGLSLSNAYTVLVTEQ